MSENLELPPWLWPRAAYLHVPFCQHHCGYCDFAVTAGQDHLIDLYVEAVAEELQTLGTPTTINTIFLGGGTPTYLSFIQLDRLLTAINQWLPLRPGGEFSIEATPESITSEKVAVLADHGVNRVSLGVQSFHPKSLGQLDRIHGPEHVGPTLERIRRRIDNVSLDLIFGVPDQSIADWEADLTSALVFEPEHISTYGLTYEKGTPLWKRREHGDLQPVAEADEATMYEIAMEQLPFAGFEQYEVSNFAKLGRRCRHNETYWANEAYFGFGVGAARYVMGRRELNRRNTEDYIRNVLAGESPTFQSEELQPEDGARETACVQMRRADGVIRDQFYKRTGFDFDELTKGRVAPYVAEGLLKDDGRAVSLTRRGRCLADSLVVRIVWG
ncbi:MAG TPA: radical SAM family heme chaperone HemW [Gemmataceae bacterium]|nr:radical SAM family heme chaperone HemW [Gemmataceae bacterium]